MHGFIYLLQFKLKEHMIYNWIVVVVVVMVFIWVAALPFYFVGVNSITNDKWSLNQQCMALFIRTIVRVFEMQFLHCCWCCCCCTSSCTAIIFCSPHNPWKWVPYLRLVLVSRVDLSPVVWPSANTKFTHCFSNQLLWYKMTFTSLSHHVQTYP